MMTSLQRIILLIFSSCLVCAVLAGQTKNVSLRTVPNYNQWGWNAIVMQNGFVTLATVPSIGGRVMQYDLGDLPSVFVNSSELGKTYSPAQNSQWHNFGGFKTWPAPQSQWNAGGWPPPPTLDFGAYTVLDTVRTDDSAQVEVSSPVEKWIAPGIMVVRKATMYPGTSHVKMDETFTNQGTQDEHWSIWGVTQSPVNHPGRMDYQNYWAYFPINVRSLFGQSGVSPQGRSQAWKGEVAPGVYGVQFSPDNQKIYADPQVGWIAYANISDTVVFARTFDVFEGAQYPENGCRVTVYVSGPNPLYMEVETKSPMINLAANGGTYTFTEHWWAARVRAPIVFVNAIGAVAGRLAYNSATHLLSGTYGVFHEGAATVALMDSSGQVLAEGVHHQVSPLVEFAFTETLVFPNDTRRVELRVRNALGELVGVLDSATVPLLLTAIRSETHAFPSQSCLVANYPNPFNPSTTIGFTVSLNASVSLKVFDLLGREIAVLTDRFMVPGNYEVRFDGAHLASGVYVYRLSVVPTEWRGIIPTGPSTESKTMLLVK